MPPGSKKKSVIKGEGVQVRCRGQHAPGTTRDFSEGVQEDSTKRPEEALEGSTYRMPGTSETVLLPVDRRFAIIQYLREPVGRARLAVL